MPVSLTYASASLEAFLASKAAFSVVRSVASEHLQRVYGSLDPIQQPVKTLYILDSSFNPPQVAHRTLAQYALSNANGLSTTSRRLLVLFSTHNADKSPSPAAFEHRLAMMVAFAEDICNTTNMDTVIDVGLTDKPYYNDKTTAIEQSGIYPSAPRHVHLIGFDSLTRIFDPKYYPSHNPPLSALNTFFQKNGFYVMLRPDSHSDEAQQREFIEDVRCGKLDAHGAQRAWADQIEVVAANSDCVAVSSTRVREAVKQAEWRDVQTMCTAEVTRWIKEKKLYRAAEAYEDASANA